MKEKMPQHAGELRVHCTRFRGNPCMYFKKDEKRSYIDSSGGDHTTCIHQSLELCKYSLVEVNLLVLRLKKNGIDIRGDTNGK